MAKYWGSVQGNRGEATRLGHSHMVTCAAHEDGAVEISLVTNRMGHLHVGVCVGDWNIGKQRLYNTQSLYMPLEHFRYLVIEMKDGVQRQLTAVNDQKELDTVLSSLDWSTQ